MSEHPQGIFLGGEFGIGLSEFLMQDGATGYLDPKDLRFDGDRVFVTAVPDGVTLNLIDFGRIGWAKKRPSAKAVPAIQIKINGRITQQIP